MGSAKNDQLSLRQMFDLLARALPFTEGVVITTLPRGTLQVVQPARLSEAVIKGYHREAQADDHLTWQAITEGRIARITDGDEAVPYVTKFLAPLSLRYAVAVPLRSPVMAGYPGALHVYRSADAGDFNEAELHALVEVAHRIDVALDAARAARRTPGGTAEPVAGTRIFLFDAQFRPVPVGEPVKVDSRLHHNMVEAVRDRLALLTRLGAEGVEPVSGDRLLLADQYGDHKTFRVVTYAKYPALGEGPFVALNLIPCPAEWATLKSTDFAADAELSRLVPALRFMATEFHRSPTLVDIAKQVHLSPFHFHRRFTELMGLTPKHFLLDCQIDAAKAGLLAGEKELAGIASDCGFAHQSHFTSRFKQATGLTPTRWRRVSLDRAKQQA
ncbi:MAG TPA: AraC family transcriptional regulator [Tepidisphaeraceae bacterium]|nr:AraC family transcriptional regulator [Tepidisphaeraceae bacterium]